MRSLLYVPGISERMVRAARESAADALILDLEDAIAPEKKVEARAIVSRLLGEVDFGDKEIFVRINALATGYGFEDLRAVAAIPSAGILIPKVEAPAEVMAICQILRDRGTATASEPERKLLCLIESPRGVLSSREIAATNSSVAGLVFGSADFVREAGCRLTAGEPELLFARSQILLAARAAGIEAFDSPHFVIADSEGLRLASWAARNLGYAGKTIIHPSQIAAVNEVFAPTPAEIADAERLLAALEAARVEGRGAIQLDGKLIDQVHLAMAEKLLGKVRKQGEASEKVSEK